MQKAVGNCMMAVAGGAALGALLGAAAGHNNAGNGAAAGALAGGAVCATMLAVASKKDQEQIAQLQLAALRSGRSQNGDYVGDDGLSRHVSVSLRDAPTPPSRVLASGGAASDASTSNCRYADVGIGVATKGTARVSQLWCRTANGDYEPSSVT